MDSSHLPPNARGLPALLFLCLALALTALAVGGLGLVLLLGGAPVDGGLALLVAGIMGAAALGLYQLRRWGAVLFGLLSGLGSVNYLANTFSRYSRLPSTLAGSLAAIASIALALLIPAGLIYLTLLLWRHTR